MIRVTRRIQADGVEIAVVTWAPDKYSFGESDSWMHLHEQMRLAGFCIKTVEDVCENYAAIDNEIVWYGNIKFLSKAEPKLDDSIMRVESAEIASELMELTFGKDDK